MSGPDINPLVDAARTEFNLFLRFLTTPIVFLVAMIAAGNAAGGIVSERARSTWDSLIATSLSAHTSCGATCWPPSGGCARSWRRCSPSGPSAYAGAVHPLGYLVSVLTMAAWTWFMLTFGLSIAVDAKDHGATTLSSLGLLFLLTGAGVLPFLLPTRWASVLLGAGSPPFVSWLSLVSYRDVRNALHFPVYPALRWMHLDTGEGPLWVAATCLIGIIVPAMGGMVLWRLALAHFDRRIGRPYKETPAASGRLALAHIGISSRRSCTSGEVVS